MDVFQGLALEVPSRIRAWRLAMDPCGAPTRARRKRRNGAAGRAEPRPVSALDCLLLRDVGLHAKRFMDAVRKLPHFQQTWENNAEVAIVGPLRIHRGALGPDEKNFDQNYAKALAALSGRRVRCDEALVVEICLRRVLPLGVAAQVVQFFGPTPMDYFCASES